MKWKPTFALLIGFTMMACDDDGTPGPGPGPDENTTTYIGTISTIGGLPDSPQGFIKFQSNLENHVSARLWLTGRDPVDLEGTADENAVFSIQIGMDSNHPTHVLSGSIVKNATEVVGSITLSGGIAGEFIAEKVSDETGSYSLCGSLSGTSTGNLNMIILNGSKIFGTFAVDHPPKRTRTLLPQTISADPTDLVDESGAGTISIDLVGNSFTGTWEDGDDSGIISSSDCPSADL